MKVFYGLVLLAAGFFMMSSCGGDGLFGRPDTKNRLVCEEKACDNSPAVSDDDDRRTDDDDNDARNDDDDSSDDDNNDRVEDDDDDSIAPPETVVGKPCWSNNSCPWGMYCDNNDTCQRGCEFASDCSAAGDMECRKGDCKDVAVKDDDDDSSDDDDGTASDDDDVAPAPPDQSGGVAAHKPVPLGEVGYIEPNAVAVFNKAVFPADPKIACKNGVLKIFGVHWGNESKTCNTWCVVKGTAPDDVCTTAKLCADDDIKDVQITADAYIVDLSALPNGYRERFYLSCQGPDGGATYWNPLSNLRDTEGMLTYDENGSPSAYIGKNKEGQTYACFSSDSEWSSNYGCNNLKDPGQ